MDIKLNDKYYGVICDCGAEDCYPTNYIGFGIPNIRCKTCGKEWIICPTVKLHINYFNEVGEKSSTR